MKKTGLIILSAALLIAIAFLWQQNISLQEELLVLESAHEQKTRTVSDLRPVPAEWTWHDSEKHNIGFAIPNGSVVEETERLITIAVKPDDSSKSPSIKIDVKDGSHTQALVNDYYIYRGIRSVNNTVLESIYAPAGGAGVSLQQMGNPKDLLENIMVESTYIFEGSGKTYTAEARFFLWPMFYTYDLSEESEELIDNRSRYVIESIMETLVIYEE